MTNQIVEKLTNFLEGYVFTEECHVVYFLVEIRKILDRMRKETNNDDYIIVRFYADWVVHTEKTRVSRPIKYILEQIDNSIPLDINNGRTVPVVEEHMEFIYMEHLRNELIHCLNNLNIPTQVFEDENGWLSFVGLLVKVLADQPIENPTPNIEYFRFVQSAPASAVWFIQFRDVRGQLKFGNAY